MKKIAILAAIVAAGLSSRPAFANLLTAGDFETPAAPDASAADVVTGTTATATSPWFAPRANASYYSSDVNAFSGTTPARNRIGSGGDTAHSGTQYGYAYSVGSTLGYLAENVTTGVVPGDTYSASAYFLNKAATATDGDRLQGGSADTVRLSFLDSTGTIIGTQVVSPTDVDSNSTQNVWTQVSIPAAIAPPGTASITYYAYLARGTAGGVMFVDDADLEDTTVVAPEPASLGLLGAGAILLGRRRQRV